MKKAISHKRKSGRSSRLASMNYGLTQCGIDLFEHTVKISKAWAGVTCKKCLKKGGR